MTNLSKPLYIAVAIDRSRGIGKDGTLPWHLPSELKHFKKLTTRTKDPDKQNALIMGRTTWESIPEKFRPLPGRVNIVLTSQAAYTAAGAVVSTSLDDALASAEANPQIESIFIIGGARVFRDALERTDLKFTALHITEIDADYDCDTFFPPFKEDYPQSDQTNEGEDGGVSFCSYVYRPI